MTLSTAEKVLLHLQSYNLREEQPGEWRCNSPLRPHADSQSFYVKIDGPEHGTWFDHVSTESGSLYDLAQRLGIALPQQPQAAQPTKRGYTGLADYAQAHGVTEAVYVRWGWQETQRDGRLALSLPTATGLRYRFLDGAKPTFSHAAGYQACWYGLAEAVTLAHMTGQPLTLCNGEPSVVAAQHWGIAACCVTSSGEKLLKQKQLDELKGVWSGSILVALDCDAKGRSTAPKLAAQVGGLAIDLGGSDGFDLADFGFLHQGQSVQALAQLATSATPAAPPAATRHTVSMRMMQALTQLGYTFRLNLLANDIEVNGTLYDDVCRAQIRTAIRDLGGLPLGAIDDIIMTDAAAHSYHPVKQYLDALVWDGVPRLAQLAQYFTGSDSPITYTDGTQASLLRVYLRRWMVGAIAKVYDHAQNMMFVLAGPQGSGKSTFVRWLCQSLPDLHMEGAINVADKDSFVRLMTKWIWEVGELDATTRKADVSALKDFITQEYVTVRRSYGRADMRKPATSSLFGTVNEADGFLADSTGNRRFLVVTITDIDFTYQQLDIDQLWAEVMYLYRAGEPWRLSPEETLAQTEANKKHETSDILEGWLDRHFWIDTTDQVGMTTSDIIDHLRSKEIPVNADRQWEMRIGSILRRRGLVKSRQQTGLIRAYRWYGLVTK
jgi:energy-coupling factor transporter ATP-binding protein EcfA2